MSDKSPLEVETSKEIVDGDILLLEELLAAFVENSSLQLEQIGNAIQGEDAEKVRFFSHQLKSACKSLAAEEAAVVAYTLERKGENGDFKDMPDLFEELTHRVDEIGSYYSTGRWKADFII